MSIPQRPATLYTCSPCRTGASITRRIRGVLKCSQSWRIVKEEPGTVFRPRKVQLLPLLEADSNRDCNGDHSHNGDQKSDHRALLSSRTGISPGCDKQPGECPRRQVVPFTIH